MGNRASKKRKIKHARPDVYVVGYNGDGQLGIDSRHNAKQLTLWNEINPYIPSIKQIHCTCDSTIFMTEHNRYWLCGDNHNGTLCDVPDFIQPFYSKPIQYSHITWNINKVCTSYEGTITWISNQRQFILYAPDWRYGAGYDIPNIKNVLHAQGCIVLCKPSIDFSLIFQHWIRTIINMLYIPPEIVNTIHTFYEMNELYQLNYNKDAIYNKDVIIVTQMTAFNDKHIIKIVLKSKQLYLLDNYGILWVCKYDNDIYSKQPIKGASMIDYCVRNKTIIKDIACGRGHIITIDNNKNVYSWGDNNLLQCGHEDSKQQYVEPTLIEMLKAFAIVIIKCGDQHSYVMTEQDDHYLFGCDKHNECGLDDTNKEIMMRKPLLINDIFTKLTHTKGIRDVYLGHCNTFIIAKGVTSAVCSKS